MKVRLGVTGVMCEDLFQGIGVKYGGLHDLVRLFLLGDR